VNVKLGHSLLVHEHHRELGQRMDPHVVEHMPGQTGEQRLVDLDA
jgi:hypothetical protein